MSILTKPIDPNASFPNQSRRLRLGVVGGGRISQTQAMAARMTDRWEVVAGALSSDPARAAARAEEWFFASDRGYADFRAMAKAEPGFPPKLD